MWGYRLGSVSELLDRGGKERRRQMRSGRMKTNSVSSLTKSAVPETTGTRPFKKGHRTRTTKEPRDEFTKERLSRDWVPETFGGKR